MALASLLALAAISSLAAEAAAAGTCPTTFYFTCEKVDCTKDQSDFCKKVQMDYKDGTAERCFIKTPHPKFNYDTKGFEHFRKLLILTQMTADSIDPTADFAKFVSDADCKGFYEGLAAKTKPVDSGATKYKLFDAAWDKTAKKFTNTDVTSIMQATSGGASVYKPMHPDWAKVTFKKAGKGTYTKICCGAARVMAKDGNSGHLRIGCQDGFP